MLRYFRFDWNVFFPSVKRVITTPLVCFKIYDRSRFIYRQVPPWHRGKSTNSTLRTISYDNFTGFASLCHIYKNSRRFDDLWIQQCCASLGKLKQIPGGQIAYNTKKLAVFIFWGTPPSGYMPYCFISKYIELVNNGKIGCLSDRNQKHLLSNTFGW